jgi:hypothetical protein
LVLRRERVVINVADGALKAIDVLLAPALAVLEVVSDLVDAICVIVQAAKVLDDWPS